MTINFKKFLNTYLKHKNVENCLILNINLSYHLKKKILKNLKKSIFIIINNAKTIGILAIRILALIIILALFDKIKLIKDKIRLTLLLKILEMSD